MEAEKSRYYYETLLTKGKGRRNQAIGLVSFYAVVAVLLMMLDRSGASRGLGSIALFSLLIVGAISAWHYVKASADIREAQTGLAAIQRSESREG